MCVCVCVCVCLYLINTVLTSMCFKSRNSKNYILEMALIEHIDIVIDSNKRLFLSSSPTVTLHCLYIAQPLQR